MWHLFFSLRDFSHCKLLVLPAWSLMFLSQALFFFYCLHFFLCTIPLPRWPLPFPAVVRTCSKNETYCTTFCETVDSVIFPNWASTLGVRTVYTESTARSRLRNLCVQQHLKCTMGIINLSPCTKRCAHSSREQPLPGVNVWSCNRNTYFM